MSLKIRLQSFLSGYASAFNYMGARRPSVSDASVGFERDARALAGDWRRVGGDLRQAMRMAGAHG